MAALQQTIDDGKLIDLLRHVARYAPVDQLRSFIDQLASKSVPLPEQYHQLQAIMLAPAAINASAAWPLGAPRPGGAPARSGLSAALAG